YDGTVLMWAMRRRVDRGALPDHKTTIQFDLTGVPRSRTGKKLYWLVMQRDNVDVCMKDPGHPGDVTVAGHIGLLVEVYLGHARWRDALRRGLKVEGDRQVMRELERWLRLDLIVGRDLPIVPPQSAETIVKAKARA